MPKIKNIKYKMLITLAVMAFAGCMYFMHIPCIILSVTGIRCLGCGMTRALISALQLNFSKAFSYHSMFWSLPILYVAFLLDGKIFKRKIFNNLVYFLIALGFLVNWLCKLL